MNFNYSIEQCRGAIFAAIENSQLPIGVVHYLLKDISNEVENVYNNVLQQEIAQMQTSSVPEDDIISDADVD